MLVSLITLAILVLAVVVLMGLTTATRVQASETSELERYQAYLLVRNDVAPDQVVPDDLSQLEVIDLKYRFAAGNDGLVWLEKMGTAERYKVLGENTDTAVELFYRDGGYYARLLRTRTGKSREFRMYPLERVDKEYYREKLSGKREMFYFETGLNEESYDLCGVSYARSPEGMKSFSYDEHGQQVDKMTLTQQEDVLVFTTDEGGVGAEILYELDYRLLQDASVRFLIALNGDDPGGFADVNFTGNLDLIFSCKQENSGRYRPLEPLRSWLEKRL